MEISPDSKTSYNLRLAAQVVDWNHQEMYRGSVAQHRDSFGMTSITLLDCTLMSNNGNVTNGMERRKMGGKVGECPSEVCCSLGAAAMTRLDAKAIRPENWTELKVGELRSLFVANAALLYKDRICRVKYPRFGQSQPKSRGRSAKASEISFCLSLDAISPRHQRSINKANAYHTTAAGVVGCSW